MTRLEVGLRLAFLRMVLLTLVAVPSLLPAQTVSFLTGSDFAVGESPVGIVFGDFNGDGKLDAATVNAVSGDISMLLGNGDGTFQSASVLPDYGTGPAAIGVGDFNGDGKLDLVVSNQFSSTVSVLLGDGTGTFSVQLPTRLVDASSPEALAVGDFNGDGKLDVAVTVTLQDGSSAVALLLGKGDGTFQPNNNYGVPGAPFTIVAGDFNGDGQVDLATANLVSNNLSVLLNNGEGTFRSAVNYSVGSLVPVGSAVAADLNNDGKLDLAVDNFVLLGKGDGTFGVATTIQAGTTSISAVADVNGDGIPDLATVSGAAVGPYAAVLLGKGDGTFQTAQNLAVGGNPTAAGLVDLNGDGKLDLVVSNFVSSKFAGPNTISVIQGNGDGTFQVAPPSIGLSASEASVLLQSITADVNSDSNSDLVGLNQPPNDLGSIEVWLGNGDGSFLGSITTQLAHSGNTFITSGDFNGDGKPDTAVAFGNVGVMLGNGDGSFQTEADYSGTGSDSFLAVGDFNLDGTPDLVSVGTTQVAVFLGNGDGTFRPPKVFSAGNNLIAVAIADFNHDGNPDLAVTDSSRSTPGVSILFGNGGGSFQLPVHYSFGVKPSAIAVGDFNADGNPDLAVTDLASGTVSILLGSANGTFQAPSIVNVGSEPDDVKVGDFNGDGIPDLAVLNTRWNDVSVLLGNGDGTFHLQENIDAGAFPVTITLGDFDSNGSLDLAATANSGITLLFTRPSGPGAVLSTSQLLFGSEELEVSSPKQAVTLSNTGLSQLTIYAISIAGPQSGDFSKTSSCGNTVQPGNSCTVNVVFTPTATGAREATLSITDNGASRPQLVALSGIGGTIGLSVPSSSASATVSSGQTAKYSLLIGGGGLSGTAMLTCSGAPKGATCTTPATASVSAMTATPLLVSVSTTSRTLSGVTSSYSPPILWLWATTILGFAILPGYLVPLSRKTCWRSLPLLLLFLVSSCGGGSGVGQPTNPNGTPAGTYLLTVTATLGSANQSVQITLIVQ